MVRGLGELTQRRSLLRGALKSLPFRREWPGRRPLSSCWSSCRFGPTEHTAVEQGARRPGPRVWANVGVRFSFEQIDVGDARAISRGDGLLTIGGGQLVMDGARPRYYVLGPRAGWANTEFTVYVRADGRWMDIRSTSLCPFADSGGQHVHVRAVGPLHSSKSAITLVSRSSHNREKIVVTVFFWPCCAQHPVLHPQRHLQPHGAPTDDH